MEERIMAKTGDPRLTFAGLHARRQQHGGRSLYITGTDLSWQRLRVFSHESYPHMAIADAVRISANIPFYFQPVWMDSVGHTHVSNDSAGSRSLVVDGGLLANYPIALFDSARYLAQGSDSGYVRNPETLGLQLEEPWLVADPGARRRQPFPIDDNGSYMKAIYKLLVDKPVYDPQRTVLISNLALSPRVRKLPARQVEDLLESGRMAVRRFLQEQVAK
jgi:NTE family protein